MKLQCLLNRWASFLYALWKASIFPMVVGLRLLAVICSIPSDAQEWVKSGTPPRAGVNHVP